MSIVNESGLYDLLLDSRKKEAKDFRRWVTKDVQKLLKIGANRQSLITPTLF